MKPKNKTTQHLNLIALAIAGFSAPAVHAANDLWIGNTDANFATLSNWTGSVTPNGNTPQFGTAGSSGTTLNNDISSATYAGLLFNSGASAYTIGGNAFTLSANITNSGASTQTINNAITLNNATHTFAATSGNIALGGDFSGATTRNATFTGSGTTTLSGTNAFNMNGGAASSFYDFAVGTGSGTTATSGNLSITGATTVNGSTGTGTQYWGYLTIIGNSTLTIQSGGSLDITTSAATGITSGIGQNATGTSTLVVNGGSFTLNGVSGLFLGNNRTDATGVLTVSSGTATINRGSTTATDVRSFIALGRDGATGIINLNGGVLATDRNFVRDGSGTNAPGTSTANFVFGGGTLKALANQTDWLNSTLINTNQQALSSVSTTSGNSTIDSNGFTVAINSAITGSGGFHIIDSSATTGIVNFGGANAYTGATSVEGGTLLVNGSNSGGGAYNVGASGTLGGTGSVGLSAINVSGVLSPGASVETLSSGTINFATGSTFAHELNSTVAAATGADLQVVSGDLNLTGLVTLTLADLAASPVAVTPGTIFSLINYSGSWNGGTFTFGGNALADDATFTAGLNTWQIDYNAATGGSNFTGEYLGGTDSFVNLTAVPEPASMLLGGLGLLALLRRHRK